MTQILVVEDNRINQIVAMRMLVSLGMEVDIAENGVEGVAAVQAKKYDLLFMDCQMPEMDGYTATVEIRKLEAAGLVHKVPIVALTAHTMPGDREKCLAAGMDDYLAKPVSEEGLVTVLKKWLGDYCDVSSAKNEGKYQFKYVSSADLENLYGLMEDGFFGLMDVYFSSMADLQADLKTAVADADYAAIMRAAHTIKSPSRQIGSNVVAAKAEEIENLGRSSGDIGEIKAKASVLFEQIALANAELQQYVQLKK